MTNPKELPKYRWPDLREVDRQYVVKDNQGRYGIAHAGTDVNIWAHPIDVADEMVAPDEMALPGGAILMTNTLWRHQPDGSYTGSWYDTRDDHRLAIIDDLGWLMPEYWADKMLVNSDQPGYWDYGATLGRIGGEQRAKGQHPDEMTVAQALDYANEVGETVSARGIRLAASNGYIHGARKAGRDWLIPYAGMNYYLDNRPKRGRKS